MCVDFAFNLLPSVSRSAGKHSAQWALDDVLIGMNDSSRTGFHDKFDGTTPLRHNWYRIQGGEVTVDCLSLDTALTFNSEAIDSESRTYWVFASRERLGEDGRKIQISTECQCGFWRTDTDFSYCCYSGQHSFHIV